MDSRMASLQLIHQVILVGHLTTPFLRNYQSIFSKVA
jgi:hypothetical protein